jgi:hypothetical protein
VRKALQGTGIDPLKDIDRLVLADACPPAGGEGPVSEQLGPTSLLVQGKFDADKLRAKIASAEKDWPGAATAVKVGGAAAARFDSPMGPVLVLVLDGETVLATRDEGEAAEALEKAAGKRETELKYKRLGELLAKADPKRAVQWFAVAEHVTSVVASSRPGGKFEIARHDLRSDGIEGFRGGVTLGDADFRFQTTYFAKDADAARKLAKQMEGEQTDFMERLKKDLGKQADLAPLIDAAGTIKTAAADDGVSQEGSATPEAVVAALKARFAPPDR